MGCPYSGARASLATSGDGRYSDYLSLQHILHNQVPRSQVPDELLFIIQHQTAELWMKLMLHELTLATQHLGRQDLPSTFKALTRVQRVMEHLIHAWSVLATLSPNDFLAMRPALGSASGHQSVQFREIEFILGNKCARHLEDHAQDPAALIALQARLLAPSLYDQVIRLLAARGLGIEPARLQIAADEPTRYDASVEAAWLVVYRNPEAHRELYELAEQLVALEDSVRHWRFRHIGIVERVIGRRQGTGGSSGADYLRKTLDAVLFPELWNLRTIL